MKSETIDSLIEQVADYAPGYDSAIIRRGYELAAHAHRHQTRKTGEPYVAHCLATALTLADLRLDPPVVVAGLLHDTVEDTEVTLDDLEAEFGGEIARLVDGVTKLGKIADVTGSRKRDLDKSEAESLRKMFLAMGEDVRIVLIKLADRLHNMRTLHGLRREKQLRIARETLDIFAPLANRLGIWQIKWQLEDLCLRYLEPEVYCDLAERLSERRDEREKFVDDVVETLRDALEEAGIEAEITGRSKHLYSIYKKMKRKERELEQIFDVRAVRVIVNNKAECYHALGIVHELWRPIPQEFDDYIANPKENNYRSLHTAVYGPGGKTLEVQIRDEEMHRLAEYGVAAHWRYKEQHGRRDDFLDEKVRFLRQMLDWSSEEDTDDSAESFIDQVKSEVLPDRVFVFTPKGDIRELPAGATPIDFAYYIHTDVGNRCRGAKVNGNIVNLNYQLRYGDQVEIITAKRGGPSRDWLNPYLGYVKTSRAKSKIRAWFRKQDREENIRHGREMLERELKRLGLRDSLESVANFNGYERVDDFLAAIGIGDLSPHNIAVKLLEEKRSEKSATGIEAEAAAFQGRTTEESHDDAVSVRGVSGLMVRMAGCCNPVPGDDIIGYITRGSGITAHRRDCPNILSKEDRERIIELDWGKEPTNVFPVSLRILAVDRDGLLRDIVDVVSNEKVNMRSVNAVTNREENSAVITAVLEVSDAAQLSRILSRITRLPNVFEAHRAMN